MRDYIVFFTEGFDKYNIEKQKNAYSKAFVSTIDSAPNYAILKEESKKAKANGYDNFYIFWEKNDISSMTKDMKSEFKEFNKTGALPYKYNKKLVEGDMNGANLAGQYTQTNTVNPVNPVSPASTINSQNIVQDNNITQANSIDNNIGLNYNVSTPNQSPTYNEIGSMNVSYSADHAASIFVWPINAYTSAVNMKNALIQLNNEFKKDNNGRSPTNDRSTSTVYSNKKGDWATLIYVPASIKEMGQEFSNAGAMIEELANIYNNFEIFPKSQGLIKGNAMLGIEKEVFNKNQSKVTGGFLDEMSFLQKIRKLRGSANKNNIVIFCTEPYKKYFSWCPKVVCISGATEPSINLNKSLKGAFDRIESYEKATIKSIDENPDNISSKYLTRFDFNNANVISKYRSIDKKFLVAFFDYYKWYLRYRNIDVYGNPNFNLRATESENESSTEKFFKDLDEFFKVGHLDDLKAFRNAIGLSNVSFSSLLTPYKKFQKAKELAQSGKNAWDSRRKINWEKISNKFKSNQELTPEERAELEKILDEVDDSDIQNTNTAINSTNIDSLNNNSTNGQTNNQTDNQVKNESASFDLVDVFMKKFYESEQVAPAGDGTDKANEQQANVSSTLPTNNGPLSEEDKTLIVRLYSLTSNSGQVSPLSLDQALMNFTGKTIENIGWDKINEFLVALDEAKSPKIRQEALNEENKNKNKQEIGNQDMSVDETDKEQVEQSQSDTNDDQNDKKGENGASDSKDKSNLHGGYVNTDEIPETTST